MESCEGVRRMGNREGFGGTLSDGIDVIEASATFAPRMKGNADDQIRALSGMASDVPRQQHRQMVDRETDRDGRPEGISGIFEAREPDAEQAFVSSECITRVQGASVEEACRAAFEDEAIRSALPTSPFMRRNSATRAAVHASPPG